MKNESKQHEKANDERIKTWKNSNEEIIKTT